MTEPNPYAASMLDAGNTEVATGPTLAELRSIAKHQRGILGCVLVYVIGIFAQILLAASGLSPTVLVKMDRFVTFAFLGAWLVGFLFVVLLSIKLYSKLTAVFLALLTLMPCVGLLVLLIVNSRATACLKANGIRVGLLGANSRDFDGKFVEPSGPSGSRDSNPGSTPFRDL